MEAIILCNFEFISHSSDLIVEKLQETDISEKKVSIVKYKHEFISRSSDFSTELRETKSDL